MSSRSQLPLVIASPTILSDTVAGVSIAGLLLPEAVAYSGIANMPPLAGLVGLLAGLLCYALVGNSRFAIVSATSSSAAVLASATFTMAGADHGLSMALAAGLTLLTGALFMLGGAAQLGSVSAFIAKPVLRGFAFGLAIVISLKQLPKMLGIHAQSTEPLRLALEIVEQYTHWNRLSLAVGAIALVLLFALGRIRFVPAALIVIALGIAADRGLAPVSQGVGQVGAIQLALHAPTVPELTSDQWVRLGELAFAMVLVLFAESQGSIRSFALKHGDPTAPNRDLFALGAANMVSGFFNGMPVGAGFSATSANEAAGAQTRWAGVVAAAVVLVAVLTLLPWIGFTPEPVLAAIVIHAVSHSLDPRTFKPYFAWRRDRLLLGIAVGAVLLLGPLDGLLVSIAMSLMVALRAMTKAKISVLGRLGDSHDFVDLAEYRDAHPEPGLMVLRPEAALFFANADRMLGEVRTMVATQGGVRAVVLSLEETADLDGTSVEALAVLAADLAGCGIQLWLARMKGPVHALLCRAALPGLPEGRMFELSVDDAVRAAQAADTPPGGVSAER